MTTISIPPLAAALLFGSAAASSAQRMEPTSVDAARLRAYHERLAEVAVDLSARASLADVVSPLMQLAHRRSADADPVMENRAAILVVAFYATGQDPARLVPEARGWPRAPRRRLLLRHRTDLAQHFIVSAALAAAAGAPLADAIGLYKELEDARRGSGFSFADLAADRAGTAFGSAATDSASSARRLQGQFTTGFRETHMMPAIAGLPEGISNDEFTRTYRGTRAGAYDALVAEIERRIAALPLFRDPD